MAPKVHRPAGIAGGDALHIEVGGVLKFVGVADVTARTADVRITGLATGSFIQVGVTDSPLAMKIHNRPATLGYTLEVRARPSDVDAEHFAVDSTVDWRPDPDDTKTATGGGLRAVQGVCRLDTDYTMVGGSLTGVYGQVANNGIVNGAGIIMAAGYMLIEDGGTYTQLSHLATLWLDSHLTKEVSAGESEFVYISNNAAHDFKQAIFVYAGNKIQRLLAISTASGMVSANVEGPNTPAATNRREIKISLDGEDYYLIAAKSWGWS